MRYEIINTNISIDNITLELFVNDINVTKNYEIKNKYLIKIHNVNLLREKEWFLKLALLKINIPLKYQDAYIKLIFRPFKKIGISKYEFDFIAIFSTAYSITVNRSEYRMIARYPRYFVNRNGSVWDSKNNKILPHRHSILLYPTVYLQDQATKQKCLLVHKLVALAWVSNNDYINNNVIDHIDNNKKNCYYKNLRWCSSNLNVTKRQHGNEKNGSIITRNADTGEIKEYLNMSECSLDLFNSKVDTNASILRFGKIWKTPKGRFEIYKKTDFKKWAFANNEVKNYNYLLIINNKNKKYFSSVEELKKEFGISSKLNKSKALEKISSYFKTECKLINISGKGKYENNVVRVYNIKTKIEKEFNNVNEASKYIESSSSVLYKILRLNLVDRLINNIYLITTDKSINFKSINPKLPNNSYQEIEAIALDGTKLLFKSIGELKRILKIDYKTIYKYIRNKKQININNKLYTLNLKCLLT